jgi:hypothetical protein
VSGADRKKGQAQSTPGFLRELSGFVYFGDPIMKAWEVLPQLADQFKDDANVMPAGTLLFYWHKRPCFLRPGENLAHSFPEGSNAIEQLRVWHRNVTDLAIAASASMVTQGWWPDAVMLEEDVPAMGASAGDLVIFSSSGTPPRARGRVRPLSVQGHETLRVGRVRWTCLGEIDRLTSYVLDRRRWGKSCKVWRSKLFLVKPIARELVVPIAAPSDDAALFELLAQVGGRMPQAA